MSHRHAAAIRGSLIILAHLALARSSAAQSFTPPDVSAFHVVGADRAVLGFPRTARLELFRVEPGAMTIRTTGTDSWPALAIEDGGEPVQSATLWVGLRIGGEWYATGAERLRPGQLNGTKPEAERPGELATLIGGGWLYDAGRWRPMAGYNPAFGEPVCVMIAAGSTRSDNQTPVQARTQWQCLSWPNGAVLWQEGDSTPSAPPAPPSAPPGPAPAPGGQTPPPAGQAPAPGAPGVDLSALHDSLERMYADFVKRDDARAQQLQTLLEQMQQHLNDPPPWLVRRLKDGKTYVAIASALAGYLTPKLTK